MRPMGRIADFFSQDANTAMERMAKPVVEFLLSRPGRLLVYLWYAALVSVLWIFVSRTAALLTVGLVAAAVLYGGAAVLWKRR